MDSQPALRQGRRRELGIRLVAVRARLDELRERRGAASLDGADVSVRLEAARRHLAEARAAAAQVLACGVAAFGRAAEAHERAASLHERAAAAGIGDVQAHRQQAALQRVAAAEDRQRAERAQSVVSTPEWAGPAPGR